MKAHLGPVSIALPTRRITQHDLYDRFFKRYYDQDRRASLIFQNAAVEQRHVALPLDEFYAEDKSFAERNQAYWQAALSLGKEAAQKALDEAGIKPQDLDDFLVVSATGYAMPDLDVYLARELGMRPDVRRLTLGETGSHAALTALHRARQSVLCGARHALILAVDISSACFHPEPEMDNIVASAIFSDGAAACVVGPERGPEIVATRNVTLYDGAEDMGWQLTDRGLRFILSRRVPDFIAGGIGPAIHGFLSDHDLKQSDIRHWISHPGGKKILTAIESQLGLPETALAASHRILADYGNMGSPTVLLVYRETLNSRSPQPGDWGVMIGLGPGLTVELALLRW